MSLGPAVTVLVSSYNYAQYLGETLQSVLEQSWQDFELLVVDDGSSDGSLALARTFAAKDARVRVLTHADGKNHGLPATLALGIAQARGESIAFLESDDRWRPHSLRLRLQALARSNAGVVFNDIDPLPMPGTNLAWFHGYVSRVMREHARRLKSSAASGGAGEAFSLHTAFFTENKIPTFSCALVQTALLRACSLQSPVARWLDWWLWTQLAQKTTFAFVPVKLTQWRLHTASLHNHIVPRNYLQDYRAMWCGFRRELAELCPPGSPQIRILRMPFWTRLAVRFYCIARESSVKDALRRVFARMGWKIHRQIPSQN